MPRNTDGTWSQLLPDVESGQPILASWANDSFDDFGIAIEESLSRNGEGGMLASLSLINGSVGAPGLRFTNSIQSGLFLAAPSPTSEVVMGVDNTNVMRWTSSGVFVWNGASWDPLGSVFAGDDPDLVDVNAALVVSATGSSTAVQHFEIGPSAIQCRSDGTTAAAMSMNSLGGNLDLGSQVVGSDSGTVSLWEDGVRGLTLDSNAPLVIRQTSTAPVQVAATRYENSDGTTLYGFCGFQGSSTFTLRNSIDNGNVIIAGTDSGSAQSNFIIGDPNGSLDLYYDGNEALKTSAEGVEVKGVTQRGVDFLDGTDTLLGRAFMSSNNLVIQNEVAGGDINISYDDGGGVNRTAFFAIGSTGVVQLYNLGSAVARTTTAANGGLEVNNLSTGGGFERVLTESDGSIVIDPVAGFQGGVYSYISNDGDSSILNLLPVGQNVWTEVNPTTSNPPSQALWAALQNIPTNAVSVKIALSMRMEAPANQLRIFTVYARNTTSGIAAGDRTRVCQWSLAADDVAMVGEQTFIVDVPVTNRSFDMLFDYQNAAQPKLNLTLKGFTTPV
jgi:hypothetical protein